MPAVSAVIFDLDDTLYPEREYAFSGFAAVAEAFKGRLGDPVEAARALQRLLDTDRRPQVFNALLAERGIAHDKGLIRQMVEVYRTHRPQISPYPDADAALIRFRGQYRLGLITDGPPVAQWAKIDALKLRGRLDEIIVTSELEPNGAKPHPRAFELIAQRLGVQPSECVYVGDNAAKDFIAPNALGWVTVQIIRREGIYYGSVGPVAGAPHFSIDTLDALDGILARE